MKKLSLLLLLVSSCFGLRANDGAFYAEGSHLIPITDTDISVKKEILTVTRITGPDFLSSRFQVNVYYEFFNPGDAKDIVVGFEAPPSDDYSEDDSNPSIHDFKVVMNGADLPYQVAYVMYKYKGNKEFSSSMSVEDYYWDGKVHGITMHQYDSITTAVFSDEEDELWHDWMGDLYYYVYHFNAHFNKGLNIIEHTYVFDGSGYVEAEYMFNYILTAANRWANNGIDDFTLIINMGDRESFMVSPDFFSDSNEWTINGRGKVGITNSAAECYIWYQAEKCPIFHISEGTISFHKKNFHPEGNLRVAKPNNMCRQGDIKAQYFAINKDFRQNVYRKDMNPAEKRILKNLPFAYRGYVFKDEGLRTFFEMTDWYVPNPDYKADVNQFSNDEKEWVEFFSH